MNIEFIDYVNTAIVDHKHPMPNDVIMAIHAEFGKHTIKSMDLYELETYVTFTYYSMGDVVSMLSQDRVIGAVVEYGNRIKDMDVGSVDHHTHMGFYLRAVISCTLYYGDFPGSDDITDEYAHIGYLSQYHMLYLSLQLVKGNMAANEYIRNFAECIVLNQLTGRSSEPYETMLSFIMDRSHVNMVSPYSLGDSDIMPFVIDLILSDDHPQDLFIQAASDGIIKYGYQLNDAGRRHDDVEIYIHMKFYSSFHRQIGNYNKFRDILRDVAERLKSRTINEQFEEHIWCLWGECYVLYLCNADRNDENSVEDVSRYNESFLVEYGDIFLFCIDRIRGRIDDDKFMAGLRLDYNAWINQSDPQSHERVTDKFIARANRLILDMNNAGFVGFAGISKDTLL